MKITLILNIYDYDGVWTDPRKSNDHPDIRTLDRVKLQLSKGEKVAILGAIGSGKSTLLKILAGLYKPTEGFVYLNGVDLQFIKRDLLNETISYLPQNTKLFKVKKNR